MSAHSNLWATIRRLQLPNLALAAIAIAVLDACSILLAKGVLHVETFSPAEGVALALSLLSRRPRGVLVACALGSVLGELASGTHVADAFMISLVTYAGVGLALFAVRTVAGPEMDFRNWGHLVKFLAVAWIAASLIAVPGSLLQIGLDAPATIRNWLDWSFSTALSYSIFTPTLGLLATLRSAGRASAENERKILVANISMLALLVFVFSESTFPAGFMVTIGLIGVAFYGEIEATSLALLFTSVVAMTATAMGRGPWALIPGNVTMRLDAVQVFLAALTISIIPTAAAITERRRLREEARRAGEALAESEALYRLLAENASDIVIRTDLEGRIIYAAPSVERILGYTAAELQKVRYSDLVHTDDARKLKDALVLACAGVEAPGQRIEYRAQRRDGSLVWLESSPGHLGDGEGNIVGVVDTARDVTERKAMEAALVDARERAEAAATAKSQFLANMSHELKTPLTSAIGFADALNDYCDLDARARRFADGVRTSSLALLSTVNDILDYSRLERGQLSYEPAFFPLRRAIDETLAMFTVQAVEKGLQLKVEFEDASGDLEVFADPRRIRQVLLNLIGNAIKFTNEGAVTLKVRCRTNPGQLRCEIIDTGPGIDARDLNRLFERFSRLAGAGPGGTGLGLAICKGIVQAMDGDIGVSTGLGSGSCFWFEIPVQLSRGDRAAAAS